MFNKDVSYLYSDEFLTSSSLNEKELSRKVSNFLEYQSIRTRICQKTAPIFINGHRSKHILLLNKQSLKHDKRYEKNRIIAQRLKEKRQLFKENLQSRIKKLEDKRSYLENHFIQLQSNKQDLKNEINNHFSMDSIPQLLLTKKEKIPFFFDQYSNNFDLFNMSITNTFNLNNNIDDNLDN